MNKFLLFIALLVCSNANAYFGLGPCCSGVTCGVIPCDNTCAVPAFRSFTNSFKLNLNNLESSTNNYINLLSKTNSNNVDFFNTLANDENSITDQVAESYSRYATGFSANFDLLTNSYIHSNKTCMDGITNSLKNINLSQASKIINESLSIESLPKRELSIINNYERGINLIDSKPDNNTQVQSLLTHEELENDVRIEIEILRGNYFDIYERYINGSQLSLSELKKLAILLSTLDESKDKNNAIRLLSLSYSNQNLVNESFTDNDSLEKIQKSEPSSLQKQLALWGQVENSKINHLLKLVKIGD